MPAPAAPTAAGATAVADFMATVSALTIALIGVDYFSLLWSFAGALYAHINRDTVPASTLRRSRVYAVLYVVLSTLAGAALGTWLAGLSDQPGQPLRIVCCLVAGGGAQVLLSRLQAGLAAAADRFLPGGKPHG